MSKIGSLVCEIAKVSYLLGPNGSEIYVKTSSGLKLSAFSVKSFLLRSTLCPFQLYNHLAGEK